MTKPFLAVCLWWTMKQSKRKGTRLPRTPAVYSQLKDKGSIAPVGRDSSPTAKNDILKVIT